MKLFETLQQRKAVRAYLDKPVEKEKIHAIFDAARHAPSGLNTPPWQVTGNTKQTLQSTIEIAFRAGNKGAADYEYYPTQWIEPYKSRRKDCSLLMYQTLKIERADKQRQIEQWAANYSAFDAPRDVTFFHG
jgi:nitroreductase